MTNNRELLSQPDTGCRPPRGFDYTPAVLQSQTGAKLSPCSSSQLRGKFPPTHRTGTRSGFATPRIALHRRKSPISIISIGELIEEFAFATPEPISREPSQSRYTKSIHVKKKKNYTDDGQKFLSRFLAATFARTRCEPVEPLQREHVSRESSISRILDRRTRSVQQIASNKTLFYRLQSRYELIAEQFVISSRRPSESSMGKSYLSAFSCESL